MYNVIGSGTAAWIACLYLLNAGKSVTLHRDPDVVVRRIGESTVPTINEIPAIMGVSDQDFLNRVNGFFKYGTQFCGWTRANDWLYYSANETDNLETQRNQTYAYHIDAPGFCEVLQQWCLQQDGFTLYNSKFTPSKYRKSQFYIDATGATGVLSEIAGLQHRASDYLINDRAVIGNGPAQYIPFTRSTALSRGWLWQISLQSRCSYGYVYSSKYLSDAEAESEFCRVTGTRKEAIINFSTRIPERAYIDNILFLGLSAGFIEPLNATANFAAQSGIKNFILLEDKPEVYNRLINRTYDGIHKWISALYSLNNNTGEYWDYYKSHAQQARRDIEFYSEHGHQGLMGKHSWSLLGRNMK